MIYTCIKDHLPGKVHIFCLQRFSSKDKPKTLKRDFIYNIDMLFWKKGFRRLFTFTVKALSYTYVPVRLVHFTHSASTVRNRKTQRSVFRGRGTSVSLNHQ